MNTGSDPEMLELFRAEMDAHLPVLSQGLLALEKGHVPAQQIEAMMRAAHSIKGAMLWKKRSRTSVIGP